jgi:hypothetical protein
LNKIDFSNKSEKYDNADLIYRIANGEYQLQQEFNPWILEGLYNFKRVSGKILSQADKNKLYREGRPDFQHNLFLPTILKIAGNHKANFNTIEADPTKPQFEDTAEMFTDLLKYELYQVNDIDYEFSKAFLDALIARIGWVVLDWLDNADGGDAKLRRYLWTRIKFDRAFQTRDGSDIRFMSDSAWYTPEEILENWGVQDDELWSLIDERIEEYIPRDIQNKRRIVSFFERILGNASKWFGRDSGYDEISMPDVDDFHGGEGIWWKQAKGLFKVTEWHEKRFEKRWYLHFPDEWKNKVQTADITDHIDWNGRRFDRDKVVEIKKMYPDSFIDSKAENKIWKTAVCPALQLVLCDKPYDVQINRYKYTPVLALDFGIEAFDHKSVIDHIVDPVNAYNKKYNQILEHLASLQGETWVEETALGEYEDEFSIKQPGATKIVKDGTITKGRIQRVQPANLPAGIAKMMSQDHSFVDEVLGQYQNAKGGSETQNESGKAIGFRIQQSDEMLGWLNDNAVAPLKAIGEMTKSLIQANMTIERIIPIVRDEGRDWLYVNFRTIEGVKNDVTTGKYNIVISKKPHGKLAKQRAFEMFILVNDRLLSMNPMYPDPVSLIKAAPDFPNKQEAIQRVQIIDQILQQQMLQQQLLQNEQQAVEQQNNQLTQQGQMLSQQSQYLANKQTQSDLDLDEHLKNTIKNK